MIRLLSALPAFAIVAAASVASAQSPTPEAPSDDNRYTFNKVEDGFLRLDNKTGQVSLCSRRTVGWACQTVADERSALEGEIARLQADNAALKRELIARNIPLPSGVRPEAPAAKSSESELKLPSNADLDRMMNFMEKVWRRLVEMMVSIQKDVMKKS
jgi:hypothetical protein